MNANGGNDGGGGKDKICGGDDTIIADDDERGVIRCGKGFDTVVIDGVGDAASDRISDCDVVSNPE